MIKYRLRSVLWCVWLVSNAQSKTIDLVDAGSFGILVYGAGVNSGCVKVRKKPCETVGESFVLRLRVSKLGSVVFISLHTALEYSAAEQVLFF